MLLGNAVELASHRSTVGATRASVVSSKHAVFVESGAITHITNISANMNGHKEELPKFIKLGHYPIVLGLPWMRCHDISIAFSKNTITFDSDFCLTHCCPKNAVTIQGISIHPPEKLSIALIAGSTFTRTLYRKKGIVAAFKKTLYEIDKALRKSAPQAEDDKIRELVPEGHHEFLPFFKKAVAEPLPPHCSYNYKIPLKEGFTPPLVPSTHYLSRNSKPYINGLMKTSSRNLLELHLLLLVHLPCLSKRKTDPSDYVLTIGVE